MIIKYRNFVYLLLVLFVFSCCSKSGDGPDSLEAGQQDEEKGSKETYFAQDIWNVEPKNDYQNNSSQFSVFRMKKTKDFAAFWEAEFGDDPSRTTDTDYRFQIDDLLLESEEIYEFYRDSLKFVEKGKSLTDKYRMNLYIYYTDEGTVYGGGAENKIGVMWLAPGRIKTKPYATMAHEMGHAFQYMVSCDGHWGFTTGNNGAFFEMTSQFMLFQFYPNWMTFENYHFQNFMQNTHKAFMHEDNMYCSPYVLEYWTDKHGRDFIGKLWREAQEGEDPVLAYQRLTGIGQEAFNDEILDASMKFITWDMDRIRNYAKDYANKHSCVLNSIGNGWYRIAESRCLQNYGYNGIRLEVPDSGTKVVLNFKGIAGAEGYHKINVDKAGWGYAFLAVKTNGERVYDKHHFGTEGQIDFIVPDNTAYLWLVVTGAPTTHWAHNNDNYAGNDEQWPYEIKLTNTKIQQ